MTELNEGYVVGLLSDIEAQAPRLLAELNAGKKKAAAVDAELSNLLRRLDECRASFREARHALQRCSAAVNDGNSEIATLHTEIAMLQKRAEDVKVEMERVLDEPAIRRKLRRERAKIKVQIQEKQEEIEAIKKNVEVQREQLAVAEKRSVHERDREKAMITELDALQSQLPSPYLYTRLFENLAARAHCNLYLDRRVSAWGSELREAIQWTLELHRELRAGKYRLDKNSDLVGGRAMASAEAMYGAVALGDLDLAREIFALATDENLYFHQIFNVFRVWCLGLYLHDRHKHLRELLRLHQFAEGLRGGYGNAFIGLLTRDRRRVAVGLKDITRHEWELWQDPNLVRGAGVINLGAVALSRLAYEAGMEVPLPGPTVPPELLTWSKNKPQPSAHSA